MSSSKYQKVIEAMEKRIAMAMAQPQNSLSLEQPARQLRYKTSNAALPETDDLKNYQKRAALSSWFIPDTLFNLFVSDGTKSVVLNQLERDCEKRKTDKIEWLMKKTRRTYIINELHRTDSLQSTLSAALPSTDNAGVMMREVLRGKIYDIASMDNRQALDLIHALELLSDAVVPKQSVEAVREKLRGKFLSEYDVLLQNYVGRGQALIRLHEFIGLSPQRFHAEAIIITGIGGAGKSTLLAKFLHEVRDKELASIAILDFDRPGVDADDKNWLLLEMITQLAHQYPQIKSILISTQDHIRRQINNQERLNLKEKLSSSDLREQTSILFSVRNALMKIGAGGRPWLIVFDTFEEIRSRLKTESLITWVGALSETLADVSFKMIISGRLFDQERNFNIYGHPVEIIEVDEFEEDVATSFLKKLKLPESTISEIIADDAIPLRPLELKLLARLFEDPSFDLKQIKDESANAQFAGKDLFLGIVYRRVLARIGDVTARKLAYPGLVLRYLTVPVIQNILVPSIYNLAVDAEKRKKMLEEDEQPIGLLADDQMQQSLNELAIRGWLSYRGPNGEVVHQKYLRRSMLKLMISKDPQKAIEIHNAAIRYFAGIGTDEATAEVLYHQLMLLSSDANAVSFNGRDIKSLLSYIKNNIEDLPRNAAVLVQYVETGEVSQEEMILLPRKFYHEASLSTIKKYNKRREFLAAVELIKKNILNDQEMIDVCLEPMFKTGEWKWVRKAIPSLRKRENTSKMLDDLFYKSFADNDEARLDMMSFLTEPIMKSYTFKNFKQGMDRNVVSKIAHISTLYNTDVKKPAPANSFRAMLTEFTLMNTKQRSKDTSHLRVRGINLLRMLTPDISADSTFTPALVKIDPKWLMAMRKYLDESKQLLSDALTAINDDKSRSVKSILSRLDALSRNRIKSTFTAPLWAKNASRATVLKLLRGPDPEFRDLCRYALLDVFQNWKLVPLGRIIAEILPVKVTDFERSYDDLHGNLRYPPFDVAIGYTPEKSLEDYIEFVDRCWALGPLMKAVLEAYPKAKKLRLVYERYQVWDKAVKLAIANAYDAEMKKEREKKRNKKKKPSLAQKTSKKIEIKKKK